VLVIRADNIEGAWGTLAYWLADAAYQVSMGARLYALKTKTADYLKGVTDNLSGALHGYLDELKKPRHPLSRVELRGRGGRVEIDLERALMELDRVSKNPGQEVVGYAPPNLFVEFGEYLEEKLYTGTLKRKKVFVSNAVVALAVVGAALTYSYRATRGGRTVHGYTKFSDIGGVAQDPLERLEMSRQIARTVSDLTVGDAPAETIDVAVASIVGPAYEGRPGEETVELVELSAGRKVSVASYQVRYISSLARAVKRMGSQWSAAYRALLSRYSNKQVKKLADEIARGVHLYSLYGDPYGAYRALRILTSEAAEEAEKLMGAKKWEEVSEALSKGLSRLV